MTLHGLTALNRNPHLWNRVVGGSLSVLAQCSGTVGVGGQEIIFLKWLPLGSLWDPIFFHPPPLREERKELGTSEEDSESHKVVMMANVLGRIYKDCSGGYLFW